MTQAIDFTVPILRDRPTADEPLRGLPTLSRLAIIGRARIEALAAEPIVWAWQDIASEGQIVLVAGSPGDGKTTLLFLIVVARASLGAPADVLGRRVTPAPPGKYILLFEAEHGPGSAARKLVKSCLTLDIDTAALDRVILLARRDVRLGTEAWIEARKLIAAGLVSDVVIDTLARFAPADANDEQAQAAIFAEVASAIEEVPSSKPIVWIAAHARKDASGNLDDVSGSAQRTGQADAVLFVRANRDAHKRVTSSTVTFPKLREEPDEPLGSIEFSIAKGIDGRPRYVAGAAPKPLDPRPLEERALEILETPTTKTRLRETLGLRTPEVEDLITALFAARQITKEQQIINGRPRDVFRRRVPGGGAS